MSYPLHDFRIENDNLILLCFSNGTSARVNRTDLENYLSKPDLAKINKAMVKRRKFMKRVLPPTAVFLLLSGIAGLGAHDVRQLMNQLQPTSPPSQEQLVAPKPVPAPPPPVRASTSQTTHPQSGALRPKTSKSSASSGKPVATPSPTAIHDATIKLLQAETSNLKNAQSSQSNTPESLSKDHKLTTKLNKLLR